MKEIGFCIYCNMPILKDDSYTLLQRYSEGVFIEKKHYHQRCSESLRNSQADIDYIKKQTKKLLEITNSKMGIDN
jgi:hypothetical protein